MTMGEVKKAVEAEIVRMQCNTRGIATDRNYQMGKAWGMLKAFEMMGVLSEERRSQMIYEIQDTWF